MCTVCALRVYRESVRGVHQSLTTTFFVIHASIIRKTFVRLCTVVTKTPFQPTHAQPKYWSSISLTDLPPRTHHAALVSYTHQNVIPNKTPCNKPYNAHPGFNHHTRTTCHHIRSSLWPVLCTAAPMVCSTATITNPSTHHLVLCCQEKDKCRHRP